MDQTLSMPTTPTTPPNVDNGIPFSKHLEELRFRLIVCISTLFVTSLGTFFYAVPLINLLKALTPRSTVFVQLSPGEVFLSSFKLSMFAGFGLALPVILYHVLRFVAPGLSGREKRMVMPLLLLGLGLFVAGVVFGYAVILPLMLNFLLDYGQTVAQNQLSIATFLNFCMGFLFASGLIFQVPILLLLLSFLGLVSTTMLIKQWKWALVCSFLLGAIITPSADPFSQTVMAASLFGLYAFSIVLIKLFKR